MGTISFARGIPAPECLPVEELADCARAALERDGRTILSYGPSSGYAPLREWIAARHDVDPSRVFLTNGSLQGFVFLAQRLAPGKRVLVERPTYDRPLKILKELGADVVGPEALAPDSDWSYLISFLPGLKSAGGTEQILRNTIGERVLGLPPEPRLDKGVPFSELRAKEKEAVAR